MIYRLISPIERQGRIVALIVPFFAVASGNAADFDVTVLDRHGEPVPDVAVYIESDDTGHSPPPAEPAVMDQLGSRFVPDLLIVQTGTRVRFPNNDAVAHHLYSFSTPNDFVLPMFRGNMNQQVEFRHDGVVTLGCNIHDHMVGYILVVDSEIFGKTDRNGKVRLTSDNPGGLSVSIWSPRFGPHEKNLTRRVRAGRSAEISFVLNEGMSAPHTRETAASLWSDN